MDKSELLVNALISDKIDGVSKIGSLVKKIALRCGRCCLGEYGAKKCKYLKEDI